MPHKTKISQKTKEKLKRAKKRADPKMKRKKGLMKTWMEGAHDTVKGIKKVITKNPKSKPDVSAVKQSKNRSQADLAFPPAAKHHSPQKQTKRTMVN